MNHQIKIANHELRSTVISIVPFPITEVKPGLFPNTFTIKPSRNNVPEVLHVGTCVHYVYIDGDRGSLQVRDSSAEVCKSIVEDYINSQLGIDLESYPGITWMPGEITREQFVIEWPEAFKDLKVAQHNWFKILCRIADTDWKRYQQHNAISETQRIAAIAIGLDPKTHMWMDQSAPADAPDSPRCPKCNSIVSPQQVVCLGCRFILNKASYDPTEFASV